MNLFFIAISIIILISILTLFYIIPFAVWEGIQNDKHNRRLEPSDIPTLIKYATILYTSPFTGKKPPIF